MLKVSIRNNGQTRLESFEVKVFSGQFLEAIGRVDTLLPKDKAIITLKMKQPTPINRIKLVFNERYGFTPAVQSF